MSWWQIDSGKLSPTVTNLNNAIITNPIPNWKWLIVSSKCSHPIHKYQGLLNITEMQNCQIFCFCLILLQGYCRIKLVKLRQE